MDTPQRTIFDEADGGAGVDDWRFNAVISEELARGGHGGVALPLHTARVS